MTRGLWILWAATCFVASMIGTTIRLATHCAPPNIDLFCIAASGLGPLLLARVIWEEGEE